MKRKIFALFLSLVICVTSVLSFYKKSYAEAVVVTSTAYFVYSALAAAGLTAIVAVNYEELQENQKKSREELEKIMEGLREKETPFQDDLGNLSKEFYDEGMSPQTKARWNETVNKSSKVIPFPKPYQGEPTPPPQQMPPSNIGPDKVMIPFIPDPKMIDEFFDWLFDYHTNGKNERLKKQVDEAILSLPPGNSGLNPEYNIQISSELDSKLLPILPNAVNPVSPSHSKVVSHCSKNSEGTISSDYFFNVDVVPFNDDKSISILYAPNTIFVSVWQSKYSNEVVVYNPFVPTFTHQFTYPQYLNYDPDHTGFRTVSLEISSVDDFRKKIVPVSPRERLKQKVKQSGNPNLSGSPFTVVTPLPKRHLAPFPSEVPGTKVFDPSRIPFPQTPVIPEHLPSPQQVPDYIPSTMPELIPQPDPAIPPAVQPQPGDNPYPFPFPQPQPGTQPKPGDNPFPYPFPYPPGIVPQPGPNPGTDPGTQPGTDPGTNPNPGTQPAPAPNDITFDSDDSFQLPPIDFSPLMTALPSKFPFCIPFDVYHAMTKFFGASDDGPPRRGASSGGGDSISFTVSFIDNNEIVIDLVEFNPLFKLFKKFFFIIFLAGLIRTTRFLIRW